MRKKERRKKSAEMGYMQECTGDKPYGKIREVALGKRGI